MERLMRKYFLMLLAFMAFEFCAGTRGGIDHGVVIKTGTPFWCVAKPNADFKALEAALNFACGEGGADCSAIQPNGACCNPNTLHAHASYAFNSYYQRHGRNSWNCDFQGTAVVVISDPSYGSCNYPRQ